MSINFLNLKNGYHADHQSSQPLWQQQSSSQSHKVLRKQQSSGSVITTMASVHSKPTASNATSGNGVGVGVAASSIRIPLGDVDNGAIMLDSTNLPKRNVFS